MRYGLHRLYNKHLHQRIEEHKSLASSVGRHMKTKDDLVHEMLLIRERQPSLNKHSDSISANTRCSYTRGKVVLLNSIKKYLKDCVCFVVTGST